MIRHEKTGELYGLRSMSSVMSNSGFCGTSRSEDGMRRRICEGKSKLKLIINRKLHLNGIGIYLNNAIRVIDLLFHGF